MAENKNEELESFLGKVNEIGSIIKEMTASDPLMQIAAIQKADSFLQHHTEKQNQCNKTTINSSHEQNTSSSAEASVFMRELEEDASKRAKENKECKTKADKLKEEGNEYFKKQDFGRAIQLYSEALDVYKKYTAVFTNRAQAYIKIKKYEEAIGDCEMALKLDENCVKAYVHKGRALQYMKEYNKAIDTYQEAIKMIPKQEKVLRGYLQEAETERTKLLEEEKASSIINQQADDIKLSIQILMNPERSIIDYTTAVRTLLALLPMSEMNKTLFRASGGLNIISAPNTIITRFWDGSAVWQSEDEIVCFIEVIKLLQQSLTCNDYNVQEFLLKDYSKVLTRLLHHPTPAVIVSSVVDLLHLLAQTPQGRLGMINCYGHLMKVLEALLMVVNTASTTALNAMATISYLSFEPKFGEQFVGILQQYLLKINKNMLLRLCKVCTKGIPSIDVTWSVTRSLLSTMVNMSRNKASRELIACDVDWWDACRHFMDRFGRTTVIKKDMDARETVSTLLGLLTNISSQPNQFTEDNCNWLIISIKDLLDCWNDDVLEHCVSFLRFLMSHYKVSLEKALSYQLYTQLIPLLVKDSRPLTVRYSLKCLALCTNTDEKARKVMFQSKGVDALVALLLSSTDEIVLGNAALCLGDCALNVEVCQDLVGTDIVQSLLRHATNDDLKQDVKTNVVLCLARLATGDPRHRDCLRSLNGLEILHSVYTKGS